MTPGEYADARKAFARALSTPDGIRFMEAMWRRYVLGDAPLDEKKLQRWLGAREVALDLQADVDAAKRTGDTNG
jgi:hypothetical protein